MRTLMKHMMSELRHLQVAADVDEERKEVTLRVPHVDSALIIDFVCRELPEQGIVAFRDGDEKDATWRTSRAPYTVFVQVFDVAAGKDHFGIEDFEVTLGLALGPQRSKMRPH